MTSDMDIYISFQIKAVLLNLVLKIEPFFCLAGKPGKIRVSAEYKDGTKFEDVFDSVVFAVGRDAETAKINLKGMRESLCKLPIDFTSKHVPQVSAWL